MAHINKVRKNHETRLGFIVPEYFGVLVLEIVTDKRALCKFQEMFKLPSTELIYQSNTPSVP
uniref:Uncharacterized protein n=1 Tax=Oryza glaberrima TaxID=4538 RepID=I1PBS4_ORYGL